MKIQLLLLATTLGVVSTYSGTCCGTPPSNPTAPPNPTIPTPYDPDVLPSDYDNLEDTLDAYGLEAQDAWSRVMTLEQELEDFAQLIAEADEAGYGNTPDLTRYTDALANIDRTAPIIGADVRIVQDLANRGVNRWQSSNFAGALTDWNNALVRLNHQRGLVQFISVWFRRYLSNLENEREQFLNDYERWQFDQVQQEGETVEWSTIPGDIVEDEAGNEWILIDLDGDYEADTAYPLPDQ